jgi:hypothetical protein
LFERYQPDLVVASTPGWRLDRYLLREAARRKVNTAAIVLGWDNPSSHGLPGAPVKWISCWSEAQKQELIDGSDWPPERINIGGIPSYDGYFCKRWLMSKEAYYRLHGLDPSRKLLSYACKLCHLLPQHSKYGSGKPDHLGAIVCSLPAAGAPAPQPLHECQALGQRAGANPGAVARTHYAHLVEPVPLGGELGYYSGEDMPEKASMMAYSDVFLTVYSTMVVEASIHGTPIVSAVIDSPTGWPGEYTLPLSQIGNWPTHSRFRRSGACRERAMKSGCARRSTPTWTIRPGPPGPANFRRAGMHLTDGKTGQRTGAYLLGLVNN